MDDIARGVVASYAHTLSEVAPDPGVHPGGRFDAVVRSSVEQCFARRAHVLVPRVFVVDFHEHRRSLGLPADPTRTAATSRYLEAFGAPVVDRWRERYPVLDDLLRRVARNSAEHVREVVNRFVADEHELVAAGLVARGVALAGVEHLDSDPHNHGRTVAAVVLTDGNRLIYKPRSLGPEVLSRDLLGLLSPHVGTDLVRCVPQSLDRGTHGWQREVRPGAARDGADVRAYYRTFGALAALVSALGGVDMHHENVIAVTDHPVLVDLETVMHAGSGPVAGDLSAALTARLRMSLASTLLLPQRIPTGPYSVLMSGIGVPYEQQSERTDFVLVDRDTDAVDIARRTFPYTHTGNLLRHPDGAPTDLVDHDADFVEGLRAGHRALLAEQDALLRLIDERPVALRRILRSTAVYARVLSAATHPDNLVRQRDFDRVLTMLRSPAGLDVPGVRDFIKNAESAAFARGDIPYFTTRSDDIRLLADGRSSTVFCDTSARDRAKAGLVDVGGQGPVLEEHVVEEGLSELRAVRARHGVGAPPHGPGPYRDFFAADGVDASAVARHLRRLAVTTTEVDGEAVGWLSGAFGPQLPTYDPGTCTSMHDAGGIVLFVQRWGAQGDQEDRRLAAAARRGLVSLRRRYREALEGNGSSVASGPASLDYVLDPGAHRRPDVERLAGAALNGDQEPHAGDLMRGLPGLGLLLAGTPGTPDELLQDVLDGVEPAPTQETWNLAHGGLGVVWARYRLLRRLQLDRRARAVAEDFARTLTTLGPADPHGWCHGHGGAVLVASEMAEEPAVAEQLPRLVQLATGLPPLGTPVDLSVCHGAAGVVQTLVRAAQRTGDAAVLEIAQDYWARVAKHAQDEGFRTGDAAKRGVLGYFLGWSGVADTTLILRAAQEGRPAWVPLTFTRQEVAG